MNDFFERALQRYQINTAKDKQNAIYEITQQVVLAGLHRGGFFDKAAFYGGTCLRLFHQLPRFSEDMDFSLLTKTALRERLASTNIEDVKTDVRPFLKNDPRELDIWSNDYFLQLADRIVFKE